MAKPRTTNGHDPLALKMVELLEEIRDAARRTEQEVRELRTDMNEQFTKQRTMVHKLHADVNERLDTLHEDLLLDEANLREHETRLAKLEAVVFKATG
jgi:hypothetical protein